MFLPPKIVRLRIHTSIKNFYEDLEIFCNKMKWKCDKPSKEENKVSKDRIKWSNNLVTFEEQSAYPNSIPKEMHITYNIPSFIGLPADNSEIFENKKLPQIGYKHTLSLILPPKYPADVSKTGISTVTTLWHNNFYFLQKSTAHGCVFISGEIDGMAMNLLQQLLWNPEIVWTSAHGPNATLNPQVRQYATTHGKEFPYRALKHLMDEKFLLTTKNN